MIAPAPFAGRRTTHPTAAAAVFFVNPSLVTYNTCAPYMPWEEGY